MDLGVRRSDLGLVVPGVRGVLGARLLPPLNPLGAASLARELSRWGTSPAIGWAGGRARHPGATACVDPAGSFRVTFAEAEQQTKIAASWLFEQGLGPGSVVGLLGRNSFAYALAIAAVSRAGADLVYLNTGFTRLQIAELAKTHGITHLLVDDEFEAVIADAAALPGVRTTPLGDLPYLIVKRMRRTPHRGSRHIILTSGTTGTPRGAARDSASLDAAVSLLSAFPLRQRGTHIIAAPMFHAWGWLNHRLSALFDATEVFAPRPADAQAILTMAHDFAADAIVATPVLISRMLEADTSVLDLSHLRVVAVSGASLPSEVVGRFLERFGPVLYNLYGSTEAAFATCAGPGDLAADPLSAGRPLPGVTVSVLDEAGDSCGAGESGRIYVGSRTTFSGYTDGSDRERHENLVWTGDLGLWDGQGRLRVLGRADDVIVSGGENVHPLEIESVLGSHPDVAEVAVVGEADERFGQRVVAHVVPTHAVGQEWPDDLMQWAAGRLAPYQRPRRVVVREHLPRNETGKVLRRELQ